MKKSLENSYNPMRALGHAIGGGIYPILITLLLILILPSWIGIFLAIVFSVFTNFFDFIHGHSDTNLSLSPSSYAARQELKGVLSVFFDINSDKLYIF